jgi:hypothetical protein
MLFIASGRTSFQREFQTNMARAKSTEGKSKSDIVRDYLRSDPTASVSQIVADLAPYGISQALAQKIKYKDGPSARRSSRGRGRSRAAASYPAGGPVGDESKADSIRRIAGGMGKRVRPRDVVAALREEGITVSSAQVGNVLKRMGMRRRRGGRRGAAARSAGRAARSTNSQAISLEALIAAKKLADQLGGVQAAKEAMDALAKLS